MLSRVADLKVSTAVAAVEAKLTEQRDFVLWWDEQEHKGGNPTVTGLKRLEDFGADRLTVHRWRTKLKAPEKFEKALAAAQERCRGYRLSLAGLAQDSRFLKNRISDVSGLYDSGRSP